MKSFSRSKIGAMRQTRDGSSPLYNVGQHGVAISPSDLAIGLCGMKPTAVETCDKISSADICHDGTGIEWPHRKSIGEWERDLEGDQNGHWSTAAHNSYQSSAGCSGIQRLQFGDRDEMDCGGRSLKRLGGFVDGGKFCSGPGSRTFSPSPPKPACQLHPHYSWSMSSPDTQSTILTTLPAKLPNGGRQEAIHRHDDTAFQVAERPSTPSLSHRLKHDKSILALVVSANSIFAGTEDGEILV